jgi:hypothetical protein
LRTASSLPFSNFLVNSSFFLDMHKCFNTVGHSWMFLHCSRNSLITNCINVSSQSAKTHNGIRAWRVYTQFGIESKGLGVLWQLQFEHYAASREMGRHLHMKKRCFFHCLCNTWNTWHTHFVVCCHHNSKHFNIFSDIFWLSKIRFSVDLSSSWDSSVCQVARIELLLFLLKHVVSMRWFLVDVQKPDKSHAKLAYFNYMFIQNPSEWAATTGQTDC